MRILEVVRNLHAGGLPAGVKGANAEFRGASFGLYRPVIRFHIPFLSPRGRLVGGLCGVLIAFWRVRWRPLMGVLA